MKKTLLNLLPSNWRPTVRLWKLLGSDMGHAASVRARRPVDRTGQPLPWYTYPAIDYLRHLDFSRAKVFEYGCGNSTLWWSARAKIVVSAEHSKSWAEEVRATCEGRVTINVRSGDDYIRAIGEGNTTWDVIVIDGEQREACAKVATEWLARGGAVILDNSERHPNACKALRDAKLIQIDFHGFGPINGYPWTTSVFLNREFNVSHKQDDDFGSIQRDVASVQR
jgi:hypothetical protein